MPPDLASLLRDTTDEPIAALDLDAIAMSARRRTRRSRATRLATGLVAIVSVATIVQLTGGQREAPGTQAGTATGAPNVVSGQGFNLLAPSGFDDTIVLGAPVGYKAEGSLVAIDMHAGVAHQRMRTVPLWPGGSHHPLVVVGDRVLWTTDNEVWATSTDLSDDPAVIATASFLIPSATRGNVWLISPYQAQATEISADGTTIQPPRSLPTNGTPRAAVDGGLLLNTPSGLVVWNPANGQSRRVYDNRAVMAAAGDHAYLGDGLELELSTGDVTFLSVAPGSSEAAAFSPDGRHLAIFTWSPNTAREVVNIYSDAASEPRVYDLTSDIRSGQLVWSSDSQSLYLLTTSREDGSADRIIGIPLGGAATTIATIDQRGWTWLASS